MPESVNLRGSSGPTIGAIEGLLSRRVAMAREDSWGRSVPTLKRLQDRHPVGVTVITDREGGWVADGECRQAGDEQARGADRRHQPGREQVAGAARERLGHA